MNKPNNDREKQKDAMASPDEGKKKLAITSMC